MNYLTIPYFKGLNKTIPSKLLPEEILQDAQNVIFKDGKVQNRWGYLELGNNLPLNGKVKLISQYNRLRAESFSILVLTSQDAYEYSVGSWDFITPVYTTGTVTVSAGSLDTVTLSGGTWDSTNWPSDQYQIKFGTTNPNAAGTWYTIDTFDSTTQCTLTTNATEQSGVVYVIRKCFNIAIDQYPDIAYTIEPAGSDDELWAIVTNINNGDIDDSVLYYDGTNNLLPLNTDISSTKTQGKYIVDYYGHLLLGNVTIGTTDILPQSIYWNNKGDPEDWETGSYGYIDLIEGDDKITGIEKLKTRLFIFKENSIVECRYTGSYLSAFEFTEGAVQNIGCINGRTIENMGEEIIFLGNDDLYRFNGYSCVPIGGGMGDYIIQNQNDANFYKNFSFSIREENLYCLAVVSKNSTEPDLIYVYNYKTDAWSIWKFLDTITSHGTHRSDEVIAWEDATGTWSAYTGKWLIRTYSRPFQSFGTDTGYVFDMDFYTTTDNGENIYAFFVTKDYALNDFNRAFKLLQTIITVHSRTGEIQIRASFDFGETWTSSIIINRIGYRCLYEHVQNWLRRGEQVRFQIESRLNFEFEIENLTIGYVDAGLSLER